MLRASSTFIIQHSVTAPLASFLSYVLQSSLISLYRFLPRVFFVSLLSTATPLVTTQSFFNVEFASSVFFFYPYLSSSFFFFLNSPCHLILLLFPGAEDGFSSPHGSAPTVNMLLHDTTVSLLYKATEKESRRVSILFNSQPWLAAILQMITTLVSISCDFLCIFSALALSTFSESISKYCISYWFIQVRVFSRENILSVHLFLFFFLQSPTHLYFMNVFWQSLHIISPSHFSFLCCFIFLQYFCIIHI